MVHPFNVDELVIDRDDICAVRSLEKFMLRVTGKPFDRLHFLYPNGPPESPHMDAYQLLYLNGVHKMEHF